MFLRSGCMSLVAVLLPQSMLMLKLRMENSCGTKKKAFVLMLNKNTVL